MMVVMILSIHLFGGKIKKLLDTNFHMYRQLLTYGHEKSEAAACMKVVQDFWETGWKNLYEQLQTA